MQVIDTKKASAMQNQPIEHVRTDKMCVATKTYAQGSVLKPKQMTDNTVVVVLSGRASITAHGKTTACHGGTIMFIKDGETYQFHDINEELKLLLCSTPESNELNLRGRGYYQQAS